MGGGYYDGDVATRIRSTREEVFNRQEYIRTDAQERRECHEDLNPKNTIRVCVNSIEHPNTTPIVVAMDVTGSRGDDAKIVYGKLPMLIGQIIMKNYVPDPVISFAAIGDATSGDKAPIQVGQFESDNRLDAELSKIWLEGGGGGTGQESYELMAYYYAKHSELDINKHDKKGYFFFIGDEGFYSEVTKDQIKTWIGDTVDTTISSKEIFKELQDKYHVFFIYPQKTWEERKDNIDIEIKKRLDEAGGRYENVDFRASLIWSTYDDLDLHVIVEPDKGMGFVEHIAYNNKRSKNGRGELDVDRNASSRETRKPVENIRWEKGSALKGKYTVFVRNYSLHDDIAYRSFPIEFKVEVEINGKIQTFEKTITENTVSHGSDCGLTTGDVSIGEFSFDPDEYGINQDKYIGYDDTVIKNQWADVIPIENILSIEDPKAIVDVLLGALALVEGSADLESYLVDMTGRGQTQLRLTQAEKALGGLAGSKALVKVDFNALSSKDSGNKRKSNAVRL